MLILDIMHVLASLWPVAFSYHKDGTPEASRWVTAAEGDFVQLLACTVLRRVTFSNTVS